MAPTANGRSSKPSRSLSPLQKIRASLLAGETSPRRLAEQALTNANQTAELNVYLSLDKTWTLGEADRVTKNFAAGAFPSADKPALYGLPVSLKDCFDLQGFRTTAGTRFYAEKNEIAQQDSAVAKRLRAQGAVIVGKTNLHPLAYGITGENPDFGDCLQPADAKLLTGGSTSGGAASVQAGSAVAAIGTDTGGSIRVPAALCGLVGYRASIGLAWDRKLWTGGMHLAPSFDTLGWIFEDLRDAPLLAEGLFGLKVPNESGRSEPALEVPHFHAKIAAIAKGFLHDCDANVLSAFAACQGLLAESGAEVHSFEAAHWEEALSIYAPIQASEAAAIHSPKTGGDFSRFPSPIGERLAWGASLTADEVRRQRLRHAEFCESVDALFRSFDFLMMPCSPISKLEAGKDHTQTRSKILRYTTPLSLAGNPVVTLPFPGGAGVQLAAARGEDARLLAYSAVIASRRCSTPARQDPPSTNLTRAGDSGSYPRTGEG
jgi:Asp-tRNA(Asn)/Glu-tRNA(Gln) amidotransferase A subunit family amidase